MDKTQKVLLVLKPKIKSFGFNKSEVKSIAAKIADNLTLEEDATEEDVNAIIEEKIDAVLPFLQVGQSQANRVIDAWKKTQPHDDDDDDDLDGDEKNTKYTKKQAKQNNDGTNEALKDLLDVVKSLKDEVASMKAEKASDGRRVKLEALLKDSGTFGKSTLKNFSRMKFETEEEFDEYFAEVEEDLKSYTQETANKGLSEMGGVPPVGGKLSEEVLTDDEVKALASL